MDGKSRRRGERFHRADGKNRRRKVVHLRWGAEYPHWAAEYLRWGGVSRRRAVWAVWVRRAGAAFWAAGGGRR